MTVVLTLMIVSHVSTTLASTSAVVFVGTSQKASFRLEVDNTDARLVIRFKSRSIRRQVRREGVVAYCSWRRDGTSANPIKLGRKTAVAQVLLNHTGALQPSVCGIRSVLKRVKTRKGRFEYLSLVVARMRRL